MKNTAMAGIKIVEINLKLLARAGECAKNVTDLPDFPGPGGNNPTMTGINARPGFRQEPVYRG
jgi:hypothetical protein